MEVINVFDPKVLDEELSNAGRIVAGDIIDTSNYFEVCEYGIEVIKKPPFEVWEVVTSSLINTAECILLRIGDLLNYGEVTYGEIFSQVLDPKKGYKYQTLRNAKWVAKTFPLSVRQDIGIEEYTFYETAASLGKEDVEVAKEVLKECANEGWSRKRLRQEVAKSKRILNVPKTPATDVLDVQLHHGDFREVADKIEDGSVDLILTDPPYGEEYLHLWDGLGFFADDKLKPGGFLVAYSGHYHLQKAMLYLRSNGLEYYWMFCLLSDRQNFIAHNKNVMSCWKPILVFAKPPVKPLDNRTRDLLKGTGQEKEHHEWQQNLKSCSMLVEAFSSEGNLVVDPMCGTGTAIVAAHKLKRQAIGIDIDESCIEVTRARL